MSPAPSPLLAGIALLVVVGELRAQSADEIVDQLIATDSPIALTVAARFLAGQVEERHLMPLARKVLTVTGEGEAAAAARRGTASLLALISSVESEQTPQALSIVLAHPMPVVAGDAVRELLAGGTTGWHDHFLDTMRRRSLSEDHHLALLAPLTVATAPQLCARLAKAREQLPGDRVRARVLQLSLAGDAQLTPAMLHQLMKDGSPEERAMAMSALARRGDASAALELAGHLEAGDRSPPDLNAIATAVARLQRLRVEHEQLLCALVGRDLSAGAQTLVLQRIAECGEPRLLPRLWELAEAEGDSVAAAACLAIAQVAPEESLDAALARLQEHRLRPIRLEIAKRRLVRGDSTAVDILVEFLLEPEGVDVTLLLDEHRTRRAIPHLVDALERADRDQRVGLRGGLQNHLRCFFPYGTPRLVELGLTDHAPDPLVAEILRVLRLWLESKSRR